MELKHLDESISINKESRKLTHQVIGEVQIRPRDLRASDLMYIDSKSQNEIAQLLKTDDKIKKRESIKIEDIDYVIQAPSILELEDDRQQGEKRVAMPEE